MSLTSDNRRNIIKSLQEWQRMGAFENFEENNMNFNKCEDDELIYYRDEWLMNEYDINDKYNVERIKEWYNEDEIGEFLLEKLKTSKKLSLDFIFRLMRVLEYAQELVEDNGEIEDYIVKYANTLYSELQGVFSDEDIALIEENELLNEL